MNVIKLRPDRDDMIKDALEAHMSRSEDFILISIGEAGVEVGSTLDGQLEVFYIELAKTLIMKDWLGDD
jgi:hypothetical protein